MPVYLYRREDGSTFEYRQKFSDDPLTIDPDTGQEVVRVIQPAGIVFKGSGFYVNDSKGNKSNLTTPPSASDDNTNGKDKDKTKEKTTTETKTEKDTSTAKSEKASTPAKEVASTASNSAAD